MAKPTASDEDLLELIRDRRTHAETEWRDIREEGDKDMLCVAGKPWDALDPEGLKQRRAKNRPHLALDELGQYLNQSNNDFKANPRGLKFSPVGDGANDAGAQLYQDAAREMEYRSHASEAYSTAFDNMLQRSYGWVELTTQYESAKAWAQNIWIKSVPNPNQILPSPNFISSNGSDLDFLFSDDASRSEKEFKKEFPGATVTSLAAWSLNSASQWLRGDRIIVSSYWVKEKIQEPLYLLQPTDKKLPPVSLFQSEFPKSTKKGEIPVGYKQLKKRDGERSHVKQYLTNGLEILRETDWLGDYIPFAAFLGKILYVDEGSGTKRKILSMTRLARDPYMLYCYIKSCEAEAVGGVPRHSFIGYKGQFHNPDQWVKANHEPVAFNEANAHTEETGDREVLPLPQHQPWDPPLQNLELAAEAARRAIQSAMGITPLPTPMQRENQKSGAALSRIESSGQRGSFHFFDHARDGLHHIGVMFEDLFDKIHTKPRTLPTRTREGATRNVRINDPKDPQSIQTKGDYTVTVDEGPSDASARESADQFLDSMVTNLPGIMQVTGPQPAAALLAKSIRAKRNILGPSADIIADVIEPPQFKAGQQPPPTPREMQMQMQLQQAQQMIQQLQMEKQGKVTEMQGKLAIEQVKSQATSQDKAADRAVKLDIAAMQSHLEQIGLFMEELKRLGGLKDSLAERLHDAGQRDKDRLHERAMASLDATKASHDRVHDLNMAGLAHQQALETMPPPEEAGQTDDSGAQ